MEISFTRALAKITAPVVTGVTFYVSENDRVIARLPDGTEELHMCATSQERALAYRDELERAYKKGEIYTKITAPADAEGGG
jgi:hypothetical protein